MESQDTKGNVIETNASFPVHFSQGRSKPMKSSARDHRQLRQSIHSDVPSDSTDFPMTVQNRQNNRVSLMKETSHEPEFFSRSLSEVRLAPISTSGESISDRLQVSVLA